MIGAEPILGAPIVAPGGDGGSVNPPLPVVPGSSYDWTVVVRFGGFDLTSMVIGRIEIDREEGAAGIAGCFLIFDEGVAVIPTDWIGVAFSVDIVSTTAGVTTSARLFTGVLSQPDFDPVTRIMTCAASDNIQLRVESLSVEQILALIPGYWLSLIHI